jgi:hypothetical protein
MKTVTAHGEVFSVIRVPDPLLNACGERCAALIDYESSVIWIDPVVTAREEGEVIERARAFAEREIAEAEGSET